MTPNTHNPPNPTREKISYYPNGNIRSKTPLVTDKKHGTQFAWHEDGSKWYEIMWLSGKQHGPEVGWWGNGSKWLQEIWRNGKKHGFETVRYENGAKNYERMWVDGKHHGPEVGWWENGTKKEEIQHLRNKTFASMEWDKEGNVTATNFPSPTNHPTHKDSKKSNPQTKKIISTNK